ncbi:hypothetical protein FJ366_03915 [Candidatus Dependentiae bacterium]|nr:hypothetical protein [Candidatus Dependentiae bacterium]
MKKNIFLWAVFFVGISLISVSKSWKEIALADIATIEKALQKNHPGAVDEQPNAFLSWMKKGRQELSLKLAQVTDEKSYRQLLSWYVKGFNDGHLSLEFSHLEVDLQPKVFEWPGFLMTYDPCLKRFLLDKELDYLWPANGHRSQYRTVVKIDELSPQEWIEKNSIPHRFGAISGLQSALVKSAPWALVWSGNVFVKKPSTITVGAGIWCRCLLGAEHSEKTVTLNWSPIPSKELDEKISTLRGFVKDKRAKVAFFNTSRDLGHVYDVYLKIPSFSGENSEVASSLNQATEQIKKYVDRKRKQKNNDLSQQNQSEINVAIDLRGNVGGSSVFGTKILESFYGQPYVEQEVFGATCREEVWWRATPVNIAWLKDNPYAAYAPQEIKDWCLEKAQKLQTSLDAHETFFKETFNKIRTMIYCCPNIKARITIIIDAQCGSSALDFIDQAKACGKEFVTLVGNPTSADSVYMELSEVALSSATGQSLKLGYPMKVYKKRARGHNQPYVPDVMLSADLMKQHPARAKDISAFLRSIEETKKFL